MAKPYKVAELKYEVRKSHRARKMRLSVHTDGSIVVTAPWGLRHSVIERVVREKLYWIQNKLAQIAKIKNTPLGTLSREAYLMQKDRAFKISVLGLLESETSQRGTGHSANDDGGTAERTSDIRARYLYRTG